MFNYIPTILRGAFLIIGIYTTVNCHSYFHIDERARDKRTDISVCRINENPHQLLHERIKVKGEITGFHYLVIHDSSCNNAESAILLGMSKEIRKEFVERVVREVGEGALQKGNFNVFVVVEGQLETINYADSENTCFVSSENMISPSIKYCLSVLSIKEIH